MCHQASCDRRLGRNPCLSLLAMGQFVAVLKVGQDYSKLHREQQSLTSVSLYWPRMKAESYIRLHDLKLTVIRMTVSDIGE